MNATAVAVLLLAGCGKNGKPIEKVVVYVGEDKAFAAPILRNFERMTGIAVEAVYEGDAGARGSLMQRLVRERSAPQADVYWANDPVQAELIKAGGVSAPYESPSAAGIPAEFRDPERHWTGFAARARVLIARREMQDKPDRIEHCTAPHHRGRAVISNPRFGTTGVHIAALFTVWGDVRAQAFLDAMKENQVRVSSYNGQSADLVMSGAADFALLDSDAAVARIRRQKELDLIFPDQLQGEDGVLIVPNAVMLIRGARHQHNAMRLIDDLVSKETERRLSFDDGARIPLHSGIETPPEMRRIEALHTMMVDFAAVAAKMHQIQPAMDAWFAK